MKSLLISVVSFLAVILVFTFSTNTAMAGDKYDLSAMHGIKDSRGLLIEKFKNAKWGPMVDSKVFDKYQILPEETVESAGGRVWMDRNLGASQVATSSTDSAAYGDLYQWGRGRDEHQDRTSQTTTNLSTTDYPGHGYFILTDAVGLRDWRDPQNNNLWQGVSGTNNPCPEGFRIPTQQEWENEMSSWTSRDAAGAFASPLKLPLAGFRMGGVEFGREIFGEGEFGQYWSSTTNPAPNGIDAYLINFNATSSWTLGFVRSMGLSVRCIEN